MAGKYYVPELGAFLIYLVMLVLLCGDRLGCSEALNHDLRRPGEPQRFLQAQIRWRPLEILFWLSTLLPFVWRPATSFWQARSRSPLFCASLDLILGYAGLLSFGHAAYFGFGSYTAGLISKWGWGEPVSGLLIAAVAAGMLGYLSSIFIARFRHLPLIMITLGFGVLLAEAANSASWLTGGADGLQGVRMWKLLGLFEFDLYGYAAYAYALVVLLLAFLTARRLINSPFGLALRGIRENALRMPAIGADSRAHIRKVYTIAAVMAGVAGALLAQTSETVLFWT
jgi:branched-chain amino acid transport system permease protein